MKNIVWLVSYPKSGNTWFRLFLSNYSSGSANPLPPDDLTSAPIAGAAAIFEEHVGLNPFELTPDEADLYRADLYRVLSEEMAETGDMIYKKCHDAYTSDSTGEPLFPADVSRCALYIVRNPLDVCVSYANHNGSEIGSYARQINNEEMSLAGHRTGQLRQKLLSWKSHVKSWQEQTRIPVLTIRYEDMLQRGMDTFGAALSFLGFCPDSEGVARAIRNSDFSLLQQMEAEQGFREKPQSSSRFFWKGKIGNYRDYLSEEQIQQIVAYNYDTMQELGYIDSEGRLTV